MENQESQESSANTEVPFDVTEITADDINTEDIEGMEGIINTSTQSRDIYGVQPKHNKALKLLALHILKHLPEDILREEPDFLLIKSDEAIPDYGPCMECDIPILTEDPPRSLILNVCGDMIHRTFARGIDKKGTLYCLYGMEEDSDPLLLSEDLEFDDDDLFKEASSKKRKRKDDSRKSSKDTKAQTIIRELSIYPASKVSIDAPPEDSDMRKVLNQFHKLYYEIDDAEKNGIRLIKI
ncbi:9621_t:CDS:2 [Rhizophagus irregularis]|nr:9621_t:CDS:2 [Rhizophagus irregularis]